MNAPRTLFIEVQRYSVLFHVLVSLFLAGAAAVIIIQLWLAVRTHTFSKGLIFGALLFFGALVFVFSINLMQTRITEKNIRISFGELGIFRKNIPIQNIEKFEAVTFSPMKDFLGYGIRRGKDGTWCYTFRGKQAIRIQLSNGNKYLIGTEKPEEFKNALSNVVSGNDEPG